jgi:hypothetical protein
MRFACALRAPYAYEWEEQAIRQTQENEKKYGYEMAVDCGPRSEGFSGIFFPSHQKSTVAADVVLR